MSLKRLALKYLPGPILRPIRARHYDSLLRDFPLTKEPDLLGCKALLSLGDTVLDVGANIGVYTRFCSQFVGGSGHVHSLEPIPETYSYLVRNVRSLGLNNVTCYNFAASDKDRDDAAMSMPEYSGGGANIYEARLSNDGNIPVKTTRLDTLFPNLSPRLIKCDVEGHEVEAIGGAREIIGRSRSHCLVEVKNLEAFDLFASLGYEPFIWRQGKFLPKTADDKALNYFFIARENCSAIEGIS
ncbi:MAG TPA: FkbM family methyltransferase [Candidatus Aquilonibacter sp.]|nr:FkbM family methyltransferase [Candidatus Aquilonibacter sp.]